ncbi:hypothetical protein ACE1SV_57560 [Streptomyces sennicomposti]
MTETPARSQCRVVQFENVPSGPGGLLFIGVRVSPSGYQDHGSRGKHTVPAA